MLFVNKQNEVLLRKTKQYLTNTIIRYKIDL